MAGKLIIISAPSGGGKTTIVKRVLQSGLQLAFSVSACSRMPRPGEVNGKDYYFITAGEFKRRISNQEFIEWEEVYPGMFYGTLKSETARIWSEGYNVLFDVDVKGGLNIKKLYQDQALAIFIMPPSIMVLEERLRKRHTETEEDLNKRMDKAKSELTYAGRFDTIIINDDLDTAVKDTIAVINDFLK
jgi:guanylate kinase